VSGYRILYGFGQLPRAVGEGPDQIPAGLTMSNILSNLKYRFGGGVDLSHNINIQVAHAWDLGQREATITTQGIREVEWSANGMVMPEHLKWLEYLFCTPSIEIFRNGGYVPSFVYMVGLTETVFTLGSSQSISKNQTTGVYTVSGTPALPSGNPTGWIRTTEAGQPINHKHYSLTLQKFLSLIYRVQGGVEGVTGGTGLLNRIRIYSYKPLNGPNHQVLVSGTAGTTTARYKYRGLFDMIIIKYNEETGIKGPNEITLLLGCIFNSTTLNYENGSDAAIKFSLGGYAMVDPSKAFTLSDTDYNTIKEWVAEDLVGDVFTFGCLSTTEGTTDYEPVAETDSSSIDISTGVTRIADCGKAWYGAYSLGNLEYTVSTSTYSDDPNKYLAKVYGISKFTPTSGVSGFTFPGKVPYLIPEAKIHTQDTLYPAPASKFLDIDMQKVATSDLNRNYNIGGDAIMDEPSLSPRKVQIVVMSST